MYNTLNQNYNIKHIYEEIDSFVTNSNLQSPYIFATQCQKPYIFQTKNSVVISNCRTLKYQRLKPSGCNEIGTWKFRFAPQIRFFYISQKN